MLLLVLNTDCQELDVEEDQEGWGLGSGDGEGFTIGTFDPYDMVLFVMVTLKLKPYSTCTPSSTGPLAIGRVA